MRGEPLASYWFRDGHVNLFWSMRREERSFGILLHNVFIFFKKRPWEGGEGIHFLCSRSWHACKWRLTNCSHLANKKNTSVWVNQSSRTTETERWKEPVSLMIHTIVALNRPILLPALLLTWDNTLPYCWGQFELGSFVLCIRSPTRTFPFGNITHFFVSGMVQLSEFQQSWIWDDIVF